VNKTPLNQVHRKLGAKMVEFGGWEMPVLYSGVIEEHLAVRHAAGLFDVSHMGEIEVTGLNALAFVQYLTTNDASRLADGQVQYTALCYPDGCVVDDVTLYRSSGTHFMFCVNAANTDKDFAWMQQIRDEFAITDVILTNVSNQYAQLALQGPSAADILAPLTSSELSGLQYYHFQQADLSGVPTLLSRTGYTGEDGFELYLPADAAVDVWDQLMTAGSPKGLLPIGLGARDTLRLEKGYALYGHELSSEITPLEAGLSWITKLDGDDFVGKSALLAQKQAGVPRRKIGLKMLEKGIPREQYALYRDNQQIGEVTSGTLSPSLKVGIALALVAADSAHPGLELEVQIRNRRLKAEVVKTPFVE
jgi:aminomethyltransferase